MNETLTAHASIDIKASPSRVWEGLTNPDLVRQYLFGAEVISDWKVGSALTYRGEWEGNTYEDTGEIVQIEPGKLLQATYFSPLTGLPDLPENYMLITYALEETPEGTRLSVTQERCRSEEARAQSESNWHGVLSNLKGLLEQQAQA